MGALTSGKNMFTFELSVYDNKGGIGKDATTIQILNNGASSTAGSSVVSPPTTTGTPPTALSTQQTPATSNKPPNAEAIASPNSVNPGQQVDLVGTGSNDEDGTISSFLWEQLDGRIVILQNRDKSVATFTSPNEESTLEFKLTVTDNHYQTDSTTLEVEVEGPDAAGSSSGGNQDQTDSTTLGAKVKGPDAAGSSSGGESPSSNGDTDNEED
jgi:hypothetical protein